ncbi:hypothetical protein EDD17DRAFT_1503349 [Pisolithus thermaeus]|nr:hypothetical protein EDD17DRAFT_1503349 [Pisolithus thermaeus]
MPVMTQKWFWDIENGRSVLVACGRSRKEMGEAKNGCWAAGDKVVTHVTGGTSQILSELLDYVMSPGRAGQPNDVIIVDRCNVRSSAIQCDYNSSLRCLRWSEQEFIAITDLYTIVLRERRGKCQGSTGMASISARRLCMELGEINVEGCPAEVLGESLYQHIYSNGHICASILGTERSAVLSVSVVCVTLHSMLACCKSRKVPPHVKERPVHNDRYVRTVPNNLKKLFLDPDAVVAPCKKKQKMVNAPHPRYTCKLMLA